MSINAPLLEPEILQNNSGRSGRWMVVIYNNDHTSFDVVIDVLIAATGCDSQEAAIEAWEAHTYGKAPVHFDDQATCATISKIIESVGVRVEVVPEWQD